MGSPVLRRLSATALAGLLVVLSGCGGGSDASTDSPSSSSAGASVGTSVEAESVEAESVEAESVDSESAYPDGVPASITLTDPGAHLGLGDTARVAFTQNRGSVAILSIKVTKIEHTSFETSFQGWKLTGVKDKNPYFVHAKVRNLGEEVIASDARVPLYGLDEVNTLVMYSTFGGTFAACSPGAFPEKFKPGQQASLCLVYLIPDKGTLLAAAFRHDDLFDPITWTGKINELTSASGQGKNSGTSKEGKGS